MNPLNMMKMNELTGKFRKNHPKLLRFFDAAQNRIDAGSIIEIKITMSSGESMTATAKVTADDMELLKYLRNQKL